MAERNDDIKQLFSHLGLDAGSYLEMRSPPRVVAAETGRRTPPTKAGLDVTQGDRREARTYTRTPASIRPLPAMPPPAMPARQAPAVERSPLLSFFEAVKEPISSPNQVAMPAPVDPKTEANRAVTDRMIQDIKDISRRISRDMVVPPKSRWADLSDISKPLDRPPPEVVIKAPQPSLPALEKAAAPVSPPEGPKLKLKFGQKLAAGESSTSGESLKSIFDRLAGTGEEKS